MSIGTTRKPKVVVGLSGGVDSSVAAYLLLAEGYDVIGLFMKNWHDDSVTISNECPWLEDSNDALIVAQKLGIPFQTIDLSATYKERIVDYMFAEYAAGRTPNPDVLCNREIKFDVFLQVALGLGADYVATGHYCRKETTNDGSVLTHHLLSGLDPHKDQSYFLCQLNQEQLARSLFPIGGLMKSEVREIARAQGLITAEKKDSQGLCFIGKVRLPEFLQQQLKPNPGRIVEISSAHSCYSAPFTGEINSVEDAEKAAIPWSYTPEMGIDKGAHNGAHYFTVGQRKGLDVGGTPLALYVVDTDVVQNVIYVGQGNEHPGLWRRALKINHEEMHWVRPDLALSPGQSMEVTARIRYRQPLQSGIIWRGEADYFLSFSKPQSAITQGQFAALYLGQELIASGVIAR
ncbi:MAG: hypothetical protein RL501_420 [Bacteroidota bacterium]